LESDYWSGNILIGNDGYPWKPYDSYYIGGGKYSSFKATAIEIFGVNSQTNSKQYSKPKSLKKKKGRKIF